jgi:hypothetical protein
MRRPLIRLMLAAAASIGCLSYAQRASQKPAISTAQTQLPLPVSVAAARQESCEREAKAESHRDGWDRDRHAKLTAHYNARLGKCFVEMIYVLSDRDGRPLVSKSIGDSSGREYADFESVAGSDRDPPREPPLLCEIVLSSGEQMECHSSDDFDAVAENYMK